MKATIGRSVIFRGILSNGAAEHPAVITRVWCERDTREGAVAVNLTIFPDCSAPAWRASVMLFHSRRDAEVYMGGNEGSTCCFWPDREELPPSPPAAFAPLLAA